MAGRLNVLKDHADWNPERFAFDVSCSAGTLAESNASNRDEPLWSIAGFVVAAAFGTSVIAELLVLFLEQHHGRPTASQMPSTPLSLVRGALIVQLALATLIFVILRRHAKMRRRALLATKLPLVALLPCLGLILGLAPLANDLGFRLAQALHQSPDNARWLSQIVKRASVTEFLLLGIVLTILPAFVEELLFRGLLMGALSGGPYWLVLVLPAAAFGAFHMDIAQGMATFVLGLGFGFMRLATRSLRAPIAAHATYNLIVLMSMRWLVLQSDAKPNQGLILIFDGIVMSVLCVVGLQRYAALRLTHPGPS